MHLKEKERFGPRSLHEV